MGSALTPSVAMCEHAHLLLNEPAQDEISRVLQARKVLVARRMQARSLWQRRFYVIFTVNGYLEAGLPWRSHGGKRPS